MHNKNRNYLCLLINCISARLIPHMLCLQVENTLSFFNFLITGLCSFSANCHVAKSKGCWLSESDLELILVPVCACVTGDFLSKSL